MTDPTPAAPAKHDEPPEQTKHTDGPKAHDANSSTSDKAEGAAGEGAGAHDD